MRNKKSASFLFYANFFFNIIDEKKWMIGIIIYMAYFKQKIRAMGNFSWLRELTCPKNSIETDCLIDVVAF